MLAHLALQLADQALFLAADAPIELLPALQVNDHHAYLPGLVAVDLLIQLLQLILPLLQSIHLQVLYHLSLHHQN